MHWVRWSIYLVFSKNQKIVLPITKGGFLVIFQHYRHFPVSVNWVQSLKKPSSLQCLDHPDNLWKRIRLVYRNFVYFQIIKEQSVPPVFLGKHQSGMIIRTPTWNDHTCFQHFPYFCLNDGKFVGCNLVHGKNYWRLKFGSVSVLQFKPLFQRDPCIFHKNLGTR